MTCKPPFLRGISMKSHTITALFMLFSIAVVPALAVDAETQEMGNGVSLLFTTEPQATEEDEPTNPPIVAPPDPTEEPSIPPSGTPRACPPRCRGGVRFRRRFLDGRLVVTITDNREPCPGPPGSDLPATARLKANSWWFITYVHIRVGRRWLKLRVHNIEARCVGASAYCRLLRRFVNCMYRGLARCTLKRPFQCSARRVRRCARGGEVTVIRRPGRGRGGG